MPSNNWTRVLFEGIDDCVFVHDEEGNILDANPAASRRLGYSREELLKLKTRDIDAPEFAIGLDDRLAAQKQFGGMRCEGVHCTKDGKRIIVDINSSATQIDGKPAVLVVCRDITERKRHERHAQAQYEVARIIAGNSDFAVSMREVLHVLCETLEFDVGGVWQAQPARHAFSWLAEWHQPYLDVETLLAFSQTCLIDASDDLLRTLWPDSHGRRAQGPDAPWISTARWLAAKSASLLSALALPICSGQETLGILEFWSLGVLDDEPSLVATLRSIANQIGQLLDRQRVEKELRDSQALYESLVQSLPQNIFRKDRESRVTFGNERYCASLKLPLVELLGKTDFDLFPAETALKYVRDDQRIMQTGQPLDTIEEHFLPDGRKLYVHVVKTPVLNAENETIGVQGIFWDVTQEVLAHQAVAHSEKRYRQLTEATMDGIVLIDAQGNLVLVKPAAERMFGWRAEEIRDARASVLVPDAFKVLGERDRHDSVTSRLHNLLGRPQEFKARRKDGEEFPVEIALSVLIEPDDSQSNGQRSAQVLAAIRDLTERNKMRSVLVQNEKLASIGLLSAGVAHEINNPLAFVANNLVVLERDCQAMLNLTDLYGTLGPPPNGELARRIQTAAEEMDLPYVKNNMMRILSRTRDGIERVTRIVHSLRGMARTEAPRRQDARLPDMINSSLEILHGKYKRLGVVIEQNHDPHPVAPCVPTQISQVVLNVLVNAFQAIEAAQRTNGRLAIRTQRQAAEMLLEIRDNGVGIEAVNLPRVFDPFFTTKDVGEGTGLGLTISHHIIAAHGGRIEVDSKPGEGTCFRVYLPLKGPG